MLRVKTAGNLLRTSSNYKQNVVFELTIGTRTIYTLRYAIFENCSDRPFRSLSIYITQYNVRVRRTSDENGN